MQIGKYIKNADLNKIRVVTLKLLPYDNESYFISYNKTQDSINTLFSFNHSHNIKFAKENLKDHIDRKTKFKP